MSLSSSLLSLLCCPRDQAPLRASSDALHCPAGCVWPLVHGIPVLIPPELEVTHPEASRALAAGSHRGAWPLDPEPVDGVIDAFVQDQVGATNGRLYNPLIGRLPRYPIPEMPLSNGEGRVLVDAGCNWGRWSLAATRKGWRAIGVDPSLRGVLAGRRVARQLGEEIDFLAADARCLPFRTGTIDQYFSYSVLQHLSREHVREALAEAGRCLRRGGSSLVQMPNRRGARNSLRGLCTVIRPPRDFDVRYWTLAELSRSFDAAIGPTRLRADGFFSLNPRPEDMDLLSFLGRSVVRVSEALRRLSDRSSGLRALADSVWVESRALGAQSEALSSPFPGG